MAKYGVIFNYDGKKPNAFIRPMLEKLFIGYYNVFCDLTNPHMEKWNNEYSGPLDGGDPGSVYDAYMRDKFQIVADALTAKMNEQTKGLGMITEFFIGDECDFRAKLSNGTKMQFFLKEI